jgi:hypothetical protein
MSQQLKLLLRFGSSEFKVGDAVRFLNTENGVYEEAVVVHIGAIKERDKEMQAPVEVARFWTARTSGGELVHLHARRARDNVILFEYDTNIEVISLAEDVGYDGQCNKGLPKKIMQTDNQLGPDHILVSHAIGQRAKRGTSLTPKRARKRVKAPDELLVDQLKTARKRAKAPDELLVDQLKTARKRAKAPDELLVDQLKTARKRAKAPDELLVDRLKTVRATVSTETTPPGIWRIIDEAEKMLRQIIRPTTKMLDGAITDILSIIDLIPPEQNEIKLLLAQAGVAIDQLRS